MMKKKTNIHNFLRRKAQLFLFFFFFKFNSSFRLFVVVVNQHTALRIVHSEPNIDELSESTTDSQQPKKFMYISVYYLYLALRV